jgi:leader peptidase (prepilin peptidase) / N-methyltransferase
MTATTMLVAYVAGLTAVLGLLIGSFLNVVVYRVPAGLSVVRPRSACPQCGQEIRARDNIPVVSWLLLRGRCRDCATPISARYPIVELATGVAFVLVGTRFLLVDVVGGDFGGATALVAVAMLYLMAISIALTLIDFDVHRLPDAIVGPAYIVLPLLFAGASAYTGDWGAFLRGLLGTAILAGFYLLLAIAMPRGMGLGDVKLAGALGFVLAYLGWGPLAVGAFAAFLLGGTFSSVLLATHRASRKSGIPFGPWMLAGAWVGIFAGNTVFNAYLSLTGLG